MTETDAVRIQHLSMAYGRHDALRDVSLCVPAGTMTALCGANGSGKTTLLKIAGGLIQPWRGAVHILSHGDTWAAKADICYHSAFPWFEPQQTVSGAARRAARFHARYDMTRLNGMLASFDLDPSARLGALSKGRCALALFLISLGADERLYLMDEPFGGIDVKTRAQMKTALLRCMSPDRTFIISTHELSDLEGLFDRLILLDGGRVRLSDWTDDLREQNGCSLSELVRRMI